LRQALSLEPGKPAELINAKKPDYLPEFDHGAFSNMEQIGFAAQELPSSIDAQPGSLISINHIAT
jgi:hypothetical protein